MHLTRAHLKAILCSALKFMALHMEKRMKSRQKLWRRNRRLASSAWGKLGRDSLQRLRFLRSQYCLSVGAGELQLLNGRWYVTHAGLLGIAQKRRCSGIRT